MQRLVLLFHLSFFILLLTFRLNTFAQKNIIPFQDSKNGKWGYKTEIDGKVIIKPVYDSAYSFDGSLAKVKQENYGLIDTKGNFIVKPLYESLKEHFDSGLLLASILTKENKKRYGIIDFKGNIIIDFNYISITNLGYSRFATQDTSGLYGMFDNKGKRLYPQTLQQISEFVRNSAIARKEYRYGMLDTDGKHLLEFEFEKIARRIPLHEAHPLPEVTLFDSTGKILQKYFLDSIINVGEDVFRVDLDGQFGLMRSNGSFIFFNEYDSIIAIKNQKIIVTKDAQYGVIDYNGKIIIPLQYKNISFGYSGTFRVTDKTGKLDIFDTLGLNLTAHQYDEIGLYHEGFRKVRKANKWGLINENLEEIITPQYEWLSDVKNGYISAKKNNLFGIIDTKGKTVISHVLDSIYVVNATTFVYHDNGGWGTVAPNGRAYYSGTGEYQLLPDGCIRIKQEGKSGLVGHDGKLLLPTQYDAIYSTSQAGLYATIKNGKRGFMTTAALDDKPNLNENAFDHIESISTEIGDLFIPARIKGKYGYVDYLGRLRIANRYDSTTFFAENRAAVKFGKQWGFIDEYDNIAIQPHYDKVFPFKNGKAVVVENNKYGIIDRNGKIILPTEFETLTENSFGNFVSSKNGKKGLVSKEGKELIFTVYEAIEDLGNGFVKIKKRDKWGLDSIQGNSIIFPQYDKIQYNLYENTYLAFKFRETIYID